jgi:LemA protein
VAGGSEAVSAGDDLAAAGLADNYKYRFAGMSGMVAKVLPKKWIAIGIIVLVVVIIVGMFIGYYNNFVTLNQDVNSKWSEVENQYQRQADLIPNLVSVVSSSVRVETSLIQNVTNARSQWQSAPKSDLLARDTAGVNLQNSINAFVSAVATAENYPVLQANKNYVALQDELVGTQNRIAVARGNYIKSVQSYDTAIQRFPGNLFAGMFGFSLKEYYQASPSALQTPQLGTGQLP